MNSTVDVAVIGSGSAGTQAALALRRHGRSVAVIEEREFGGTCALRGCDPKKVLVHAARVVDEAQRLADRQIFDRAPNISWPALMRFKRTFTDPVPEERLRTYRDAGIQIIRGHARFQDPQVLSVDGDTLNARHIVIAAGAIEQHVAEGDDILLTSEQFLDLEELPQSLVFVGGGYIAFEFAHIAARAGASVTILHSDSHPLAGFDPDVVERLLEVSRAVGIGIELDAPVSSVAREGAGVVARVQRGGNVREFRAQAGVLAAGRVPNVDHMDLERAGIERTKKGVKVNPFLQSVSNSHVYAAGDSADAGGLPLTPVAGYTGELAAHNLLNGNSKAADFRGLATMVYTIPPLGAVGLTQAQAAQRGIETEIHMGDMTNWYSSRHVAARTAFYKIVRQKGSGAFLGATILGPHAEEQINVLSIAIRNSLDPHAIADDLFAYPTGASDLEYFVL